MGNTKTRSGRIRVRKRTVSLNHSLDSRGGGLYYTFGMACTSASGVQLDIELGYQQGTSLVCFWDDDWSRPAFAANHFKGFF